MTDINRDRQNFSVLVGSQILSKLADRGLLVGFSWCLINEHSQFALTIYLAISMLPHLVMTFFSAKLINKFSPIKIMRISELSRSVCIGILGVIYLINLHSIYLPSIIILTLCANFFSAVFDPALLTVPRQLNLSPKKYQRVSGLLNSCSSIARMIGPILALPLYSYVGIKGLIIFCFILYFLAWIIELFIPNFEWDISSETAESKKMYIKNLLKSNSTVIKILLMFFIINLVVIPIQLFMPLFAKNVFHLGLHVLTIFESSLGAGLLAGGIFIVFYPLKSNLRYRISFPYMAASFAYITYASSDFSYVVSAAALFLFGFFLAVGNVITISFYQQATSKRHTAQIMVLVNFISNASGPLAMGIAGGLLSIVTLKNLTLIYGLLAFTVASVFIFFKSLEEFSHV